MATAILCAQVKHKIANCQNSSFVGAGELSELLMPVYIGFCAELRLFGHISDVTGLEINKNLRTHPDGAHLGLEVERSLIDIFPTLMFHVTFVTYTRARNFIQGSSPLSATGRPGFEFRATQSRVCARSGATVPADEYLGT